MCFAFLKICWSLSIWTPVGLWGRSWQAWPQWPCLYESPHHTERAQATPELFVCWLFVPFESTSYRARLSNIGILNVRLLHCCIISLVTRITNKIQFALSGATGAYACKHIVDLTKRNKKKQGNLEPQAPWRAPPRWIFWRVQILEPDLLVRDVRSCPSQIWKYIIHEPGTMGLWKCSSWGWTKPWADALISWGYCVGFPIWSKIDEILFLILGCTQMKATSKIQTLKLREDLI